MALDERPHTHRAAREDEHGRRSGRNRARGTSARAKMALAGATAVVAVLAVAVAMKHPSSASGSSAGELSRLTTSQGPTPLESQPATIQPPSSWKLSFQSNFSGSTLDRSVWDTCYWWEVGTAGCTNSGNGEKEWYLPSQVQVHDGTLDLTAKREPTPGYLSNGHQHTYMCRSGMVTSAPGFAFKYGFVQIVAKIPMGNGLWPALWLHVDSEGYEPEIDMLEHWGTDPYAKSYLHPLTGARQGGVVYTNPDLGKGYHVFSLYWTPTRLSWFMDGHMVLTTTTGIPQEKMYLIMNLADTSTAPGACNATMTVKSVKVWQPPKVA